MSPDGVACSSHRASLTGVIFLMPQYEQVVAGQDPLGSGLRLLPWGIAPFLVGPRAAALADRVGERVLVVTGSLLGRPAPAGQPPNAIPHHPVSGPLTS